MNKTSIYFAVLALLFFAVACKKDKPKYAELLEQNEQYPGGNATTPIHSRDAFGQSAQNLTSDQENQFFVGNSLFNQNWVSAPASTTARDGLGPTFNTKSCSGCHFKDGRGRPPAHYGELNTGLLLRLQFNQKGANGAPLPDPIYGGQLQDQAILGVLPEGQVDVSYEYIEGKFADGETYSLRKPTFSVAEQNYGALTAGISPRVAQQLCGMGLLEAIDESTILAFEDVNDSDGDGISGKANRVWDIENNKMALGRFGWKAIHSSLINQNAGAFIGDMGITSDLFPDQNCPSAQTDCQNAPEGGNPEIVLDRLKDVTLYTQALAVPTRRAHDSSDVLHGKKVFIDAGCAKCHIPSMQTGSSVVSALSNQKIFPYTDLLLHDMGEGLSDHLNEFEATGNEWRTPPLWGIGLIPKVNEHSFLLHDGRARNVMEAILWHGGEAENSKQKVLLLNKEERTALVTFINSL